MNIFSSNVRDNMLDKIYNTIKQITNTGDVDGEKIRAFLVNNSNAQGTT